MSDALFLKLLSYEDKFSAMKEVIKALSEGHNLNGTAYIVNPTSFSLIPGSTFAYWTSEYIRKIFASLPFVEGNERTVKQGLATADDFRFVRLWWEVKPEKTIMTTWEMTSEQVRMQTFHGKYWIPLAKGGAYSPYYSDLHLVVNWGRDAEELRNIKDPLTGKSFSYLRNTGFYFIAGLTWPRRTTSEISARILPQGSIFAD